jgi:predicted transcriptional regulator
MTAVKKLAAPETRLNERKWSKQLWDAGWTAIPNVIFEYQVALGLDPADINILLHVVSYWWKPEEKPWPSKVTIARAMNMDPRSIQRRIARMEAAGFIWREQRRIPGIGSKTNVYHLDGLIKEAVPFAKDKLAKTAEKKAVRAARAGRKGRPKLHVVDKDE